MTTNTNPPLNAWQKKLCEVYGGGDYAYLAEYNSAEARILASEAGDTLFLFLLVELSDHEDCTDEATARQRIETALEDLHTVLGAIEEMSLTV